MHGIFTFFESMRNLNCMRYELDLHIHLSSGRGLLNGLVQIEHFVALL